MDTAILNIIYAPHSRVNSTADLTIIGDSNTLTVHLVGIADTSFDCAQLTSSYHDDAPFVPEGETMLLYDTIVNITGSAITIDSMKLTSGDTSIFQIHPPALPVALAADSILPFSYSVIVPSPALSVGYSAELLVRETGTNTWNTPCYGTWAGLVVRLNVPVDTILLSIPPMASDTDTVSTSAAISLHLIQIENSGSKPILVQNAQITNPNAWTGFDNPSCDNSPVNGLGDTFCFGDSLEPGARTDPEAYPSFLQLQEPYHGTYALRFLVNYIDDSATQNYTIFVRYASNGSESVLNSIPSLAFDFWISPNPAQGDVLISVPEGISSDVEIYDMVGHLVIRKTSNGPFIWNGTSTGGTVVTDGAYIVRVREKTSTGLLGTASKRLMYMR